MKANIFLTIALVLSLVVLVVLGGAEAADMSKYNSRKGKEYLEKYAQQEGAIKRPSGIVYKVLEEGTGKHHPKDADSVTVHYRGTLIDGSEFDSSYSRNNPATFGVTQVIRGWTEMLKLMVVGQKVEVVIPPELAYGKGGAGAKIGPESTLVFTIELLKIDSDEEDL